MKKVILAKGESTGHAHAFYGDDTVEFDGSNLKVIKTDVLKHEEHKEHIIYPGLGDVLKQQEYDMGYIMPVAD